MSEADQTEQARRRYREMTVARIRELNADYTEVVFLESARFYKVSTKNPRYGEALRLLRDALAQGRVLKIGFASLDSDIIDEIRA